MDLALVLSGDGIDDLQIAGLGTLFQHRGPGRAFELDLVIPLGIMEGIGHRLTTLQLVEGLATTFVADVLVGEQLGAQHPDFLGVIPGRLDIDLVSHLHDADVLAHLLDGLVAGAGGLVEIKFLEFPKIAVVIAIGSGEQIGARIEGDPPLHQAMRQGDADIPGEVIVVELVVGQREQGPAFAYPRVAILITLVQQGARQPVEEVANAAIHLGGGDVELAPELLQAGKAPDRQGFHARILDHADDRHLHRAERFGGDGLAGLDQVGGAMGGGGAVKFQTRNRLLALRGEIIEGIRQMQQVILDVGPITLASLVIPGGGAHEEIPCPEGAQIHIDAPLHVHQQGALALLLQHRQRLLGLDAEILDLLLVVGAVGVGPPQGPAAQAAKGQLL